jgi:hypothetical protein
VTYHDNRNRDRENMTGTTRSRATDREGISGATMAAIATAIVVGLGLLFYALSDNRTTASDPNAPQTTTGQKAPGPAPSPTPRAQ